MHGLLRCNINAGVHARAHGADVSLRDVTIAQMGNGATEFGWRHAPESRWGFWGFWKSQLSPALEEDGWLSLARRSQASGLGQVLHEMWGRGRWKSQNRKNVYLSPYVEEPLNSKIIKNFVPELRSRKCFSCFEIPMFYVYMLRTLWTFCVPVWICPFHVAMSWQWHRSNVFAFSSPLDCKWSAIQNYTVNGIDLFINGWIF